MEFHFSEQEQEEEEEEVQEEEFRPLYPTYGT